MTTIFCRIGKKQKIKNKIISKIPNNFDLYVEPFIGSGAIFLNLDLENKKSVINDLDKDLMQGHHSVKSGVTLDPETFIFSGDQEKFYKTNHANNNDRFISTIIQTCGTFGSKGSGKIYQPISKSSFKNKIKLGKFQKEHYKNTQIFNTDYKKIIKKFDTNKTFYYLDPPYENSKSMYKDEKFDFQELSNVLKNIKGRFLLSLNDSPNIRNIFKDFKIVSLFVKGKGQVEGVLGKDRKELLISNY